MRLYTQSIPTDQLDAQQAAKYEDDAGRYWDLFYKRNADRFFKDRHYFDKEWPQLTQGSITVLEVGCGAGNTVYPLLELNQQLRVYACDFSPRAVALVQEHPAYAATGRVKAFVADITQHEGPGALVQQLPGPGCVDYCSMVFVLSAVAPQKMRQALRNVASVLKPGTGRVLFRDYAEGDMAQERLQDSSGVKHIRGNFYARGDGTCCYFFEQDELSALFAAEGFVCESNLMHAPTIENRKSGVKMLRRWIQAVFRYSPTEQQGKQQQQQQGEQQQGKEQQGEQQPLQLQQQQDQPPPQQLEQINGDSNHPYQQQAKQPARHDSVEEASNAASSSSSTSVRVAGRPWLLPSNLLPSDGQLKSRSNGGVAHYGDSRLQCVTRLAEALAVLAQQQQVRLLGRCVLITPPWLRVTPQHQQQQQEQQQASMGAVNHTAPVACSSGLHVQPQQQAGRAPIACCCSTHGGWSSLADADAVSAGGWQQQGAAVALLALVAVWLGARRVYVALPGCKDAPEMQASPSPAAAVDMRQQQQQVASSSAFAAGFCAVVAKNECSVVVERIRPRRWDCGNQRHAQLLQREVVDALRSTVCGSGGLLMVAQQCSSGGCCDSSTTHNADVQQVIDAVCSASYSEGVNLVLLQSCSSVQP